MATNSEYAQLAAIFTTVEEPTPVRVSIDLLLLGHLPVQGGLWLIPYAGRESRGGVGALIRMHEDAIDLAIVGDLDIDITDCTSLEQVFDLVGSSITNWMVQPPSDADSTSLFHCDADRITLLSGADQAAVVGAYRLLKGIVVASGSVDATPAMNLVIVGTEERASQDAANRIVQTAHHQLGVQLSVSQPLPAMSSKSRIASQVSFRRTSGVVDILSRIRAATQRANETVVQRTKETETQHDPKTETKRTIETEEAVQSIPPPQQPMIEMKEPVIEPPQLHKQSVRQSTYASYVDGLIGLNPRCPEHEEVELAIDPDGRIHVLADAEDFRDAAIVSCWVTRHSDLLAMACGGVAIDSTLRPIQHVFTDNAVSVADLHGTDLALHLLTEIEVEGHQGIFCTPLN